LWQSVEGPRIEDDVQALIVDRADSFIAHGPRVA
jgi:hypothetical protein